MVHSDRLMGSERAVGLCSLAGDGQALQGVLELTATQEMDTVEWLGGLASGAQAFPGDRRSVLSPISDSIFASVGAWS